MDYQSTVDRILEILEGVASKLETTVYDDWEAGEIRDAMALIETL